MKGLSKEELGHIDQEWLDFRLNKTKSPKGCWLWACSLRTGGYAQIYIKDKYHTAHRVSYVLYKGPIPDGMLVCHTCDVRHCVNPDHLWLGTHKENTQDMIKKGKRVQGNTQNAYFNTHKKAYLLHIEEILCIKRHLERGVSLRSLAKMFNINHTTIVDIKYNKKSYKHLALSESLTIL